MPRVISVATLLSLFSVLPASAAAAEPPRYCIGDLSCQPGQRCVDGVCGGTVSYESALSPGSYRSPPLTGAALRKALRVWREGDPVPEGCHTGYSPRIGLVVGGSVAFAVAYGLQLAFVVTSRSSFSGSTGLVYIPVVAPITLGAGLLGSLGKLDVHDLPTGFVAFLLGCAGVVSIVDGLAQVAGLAMLVAGVKGTTALFRDETKAVTLAPVFVPGGGGVGVQGRF